MSNSSPASADAELPIRLSEQASERKFYFTNSSGVRYLAHASASASASASAPESNSASAPESNSAAAMSIARRRDLLIANEAHRCSIESQARRKLQHELLFAEGQVRIAELELQRHIERERKYQGKFEDKLAKLNSALGLGSPSATCNGTETDPARIK